MRTSRACSLFLIALSFFALCGASFAAERVPAGDLGVNEAHAVRAVVEAQLKALADDDAALAFSYASPEIQAQIQNAASFAAMVRSSYPMLIRPASISFYQPEWREGVVLQPIQFRDGQGRFWRAVYQLQQQADKRWRIAGCVVAAAGEPSTT